MWYKLSFTTLAHQLLPPILRGGLLKAFIAAACLPLEETHNRLLALRQRTEQRLAGNGQVIMLCHMLNQAFPEAADLILVESRQTKGTATLYFANVPQAADFPAHLPLIIMKKGEAAAEANFIVSIPSTLCPTADNPNDTTLRTIRDIINYYKPAGRKYGIEIYTP